MSKYRNEVYSIFALLSTKFFLFNLRYPKNLIMKMIGLQSDKPMIDIRADGMS